MSCSVLRAVRRAHSRLSAHYVTPHLPQHIHAHLSIRHHHTSSSSTVSDSVRLTLPCPNNANAPSLFCSNLILYYVVRTHFKCLLRLPSVPGPLTNTENVGAAPPATIYNTVRVLSFYFYVLYIRTVPSNLPLLQSLSQSQYTHTHARTYAKNPRGPKEPNLTFSVSVSVSVPIHIPGPGPLHIGYR